MNVRAFLIRRRVLLVLALLAVAGAATWSWAADVHYARETERIAVQATTIDAFDVRDATRRRFGALEYRGGLVLSSPHDAFGGVSGLVVRTDGSSFVAVTDRGSWFTGRMVYGADGRLSDIADATLAPILGDDGKPLAAKGWFDVEALTQDASGALYVGIERVEQIVRFDFDRDGVNARGVPLPRPDDFKTLKFNRSLECLAAMPGGALAAVTERSLDAQGDLRSFLLKGAAVERFSVKRSDDYDVSDCALLSPGELLILERRFSPARGVAIRIRKLAVASLHNGATVDGPVLFEADMGFQIDNMEGLGVHRNAQGEIILTLVSDDNFSPIQRNLLLQFALIGE